MPVSGLESQIEKLAASEEPQAKQSSTVARSDAEKSPVAGGCDSESYSGDVAQAG